MNTVLVLRMNDQVESDSIRLLSGTESNRLLAFDANLHGDGFHYGDGKTDRYYVDGWTRTSQTVSWPFRLNKKAAMEIAVRYQVDTRSGGRVNVFVAGKSFILEIKPSEGKSEIRSVVLGQCTIPSGIQELTIGPELISGENLMQLFQVDIKPIK